MTDSVAGFHEPPAPEPHVPERLIQDIWGCLGFNRANLQTAQGESLRIHHPGKLNEDAGPDYLHATVQIGDLRWRGDVEIHRRSAQWYKHGHQKNARFNSVILHVTLYEDQCTGNVRREDGTVIPELILAPRLRKRVWSFMSRSVARARKTLPCGSLWHASPSAAVREWIDQLGLERFDEKTNRLGQIFLEHPDLEHLLYRQLFRGLGYSKNAEAMESLADAVPLRLAQTLDSQLEREALYLGAAGLLPPPSAASEDDPEAGHYLHETRTLYRSLAGEHHIPTMETSRWTFFRLRPANFPTLRIAQAAALLQPDALLSRDPVGKLRTAVRDAKVVRSIRSLLKAQPSTFWQTHVRLKSKATEHNPALGSRRRDTLLINAVAPLLLLDADQRCDEQQREAVYDLLQELPASSDSILRRFEKNGVCISDAFTAQGFHQLYRTRCTASRCFECPVGQQALHP